ncbi:MULTISPECIES: ABC transporter permease [Streptomyces]|uniref:ABC transporter permease n=2 Tax=Streptomyces TaxID=1883 RepID=A0A3R7ETP6_9ACTN|nr:MULTISPECIES: ABC transporter permease [Streptomyces]KNE78695.1 ABC transporter [Streptomyces fradiae]OFA40534.1 ABC transporter [Streptomyces fradiae]PQM20165.1 ABC transporter permease [Streptomyces xinghaiensis]RKM96091.1 ABC transporter permease [Streptomyces xinghaiensis]RNC70045.1 ABC transporter permease [Streptomyces xinghaiensis]
MLRTALRNVLAHKARLLMTVLAVLLGVAFVSGTLTFTDTIGDAFKKSSAKSFDHVSVAIRWGGVAAGEEEPRLDDALLKKAEELPGAASATAAVSDFTALADKDGKLVGEGWSTLGGNHHPGPDGKDPRYTFTDGRAPETGDEVALDRRTAERTGYRTGDTVRLSVDGPVRTPEVTGIFDTSDGNVAAGGTLVLFDNDTALDLFGGADGYDEITVRAAAGTSQTELKAAVEEILPKGTEAVTGKVLSDEQARQITAETEEMGNVLLYFAAIALFVGIFIIANTFTMLVAQRTREVALMRAIGASRRQVTRSVLIEAFLVGLVAAVLGFVAGLGIAVGMRAGIGAAGATIPDGPLVVAPQTPLIALVIGVVVTMLAAWLPGRRAAKVPPVAAMNSVHATPTTRGLVVRNSIGAAITAIGGALLFLGVTQDKNQLLAAGSATMMVGVIVLTPLLSRPVIAAAAPLLDRFGTAGKLARLNSLRNPRRTASTASALMIGLTLVTGLTVVATSVQSAVDKMAVGLMKADYAVSMASYTGLSPDVREKLDKVPEVAATSPMRAAYGTVNDEWVGMTGVDPASIGQVLSLDFSSGSLDRLGGSRAVVDHKTAEAAGIATGDTFTYEFDDGKTEKLEVAGVYTGNEMIDGFFVSTGVVDPHLQEITDFQVMVKMQDGPSAQAEETITEALGKNPAIRIQDKRAISEEISGIISLILNMLYGLLAMAVIIAVLGVINTLAMSVFERKHEIGMLRAIGMDRSRVKRMIRLESIVISLFGAVLGIGLGVFLAWAAGTAITESMETYTMTVPWERIGAFLALAGLVGVLAALWPARRAAKLNALEAIKAE